MCVDRLGTFSLACMTSKWVQNSFLATGNEAPYASDDISESVWGMKGDSTSEGSGTGVRGGEGHARGSNRFVSGLQVE
jgi:hypothetical protein